MDEIEAILQILAVLAPHAIDQRLVRCVERDTLESNQPPAFLHSSGKPNRYNPELFHCVYFSESPEVAALEYERFQKASGLDPVPFTTYFADAKLPFLDLTDPLTLNALGLDPADLHTPWRLSPAPTGTQMLGAAVAKQMRFAAIRYPSDAALAEREAGCNLVIFRDSIEAPASLRVLTGNLVALQQWP